MLIYFLRAAADIELLRRYVSPPLRFLSCCRRRRCRFACFSPPFSSFFFFIFFLMLSSSFLRWIHADAMMLDDAFAIRFLCRSFLLHATAAF